MPAPACWKRICLTNASSFISTTRVTRSATPGIPTTCARCATASAWRKELSRSVSKNFTRRKKNVRAARTFFFLLVKFFETDRESSFRQADAVAHLAQVVGIPGVALLVTRVVEMKEEAFVRQIRFQQAGAGMGYAYGQGMLIHLENNDIFELVAFLLPDINLAPGKLVDDLVAAEERDRVLRRQIEDAAA